MKIFSNQIDALNYVWKFCPLSQMDKTRADLRAYKIAKFNDTIVIIDELNILK